LGSYIATYSGGYKIDRAASVSDTLASDEYAQCTYGVFSGGSNYFAVTVSLPPGLTIPNTLTVPGGGGGTITFMVGTVFKNEAP